MTRSLPALFPNQNQNSRNQCEDRQQNAGSTQAYSENTDEADENKVNGKHEHADVLSYHQAILTRWNRLSRANPCDFSFLIRKKVGMKERDG
jgi:hypothetical protein